MLKKNLSESNVGDWGTPDFTQPVWIRRLLFWWQLREWARRDLETLR
jgi:hypothetical protein